MMKVIISILAWVLLAVGANAQSIIPGFPPGTFLSRQALDAAGACPSSYIGPGDLVPTGTGMPAITYMGAFYSVRAVTAAKCGNQLMEICYTSGGVNVACVVAHSNTTTGALIPVSVGGFTCPGNGGSNCTVRTAYDQTLYGNCGGSCDLTTSTVANQPEILANCTPSGQPCLYAAGSSPLLVAAGNMAAPVIYSPSVFGYNLTPTVTGAFGGFIGFTGASVLIGPDSQTTQIFGGCNSGMGVANSPTGTFNLLLQQCNTTVPRSNLYVNGSSVGSAGTVSQPTAQPFIMFSNGETIEATEFTFYDYDVGANGGDLAALNTNAETFFFAFTASCSQSTTYLAALSGLSYTEETAFDGAVCGLVADGNFALLDGLYFHANANQPNARVNVISPGTLNITTNGSCGFAVDQGFTGDGFSCYQDAGFVPSTNGGHYALNTATVGTCILNNRTSTVAGIGAWGAFGPPSTYFEANFTGNSAVAVLNDASGGAVGSVTTAQGSWIHNRTGSGGSTVYLNGTSFGTVTAPSTGLPTVSMTEMAINGSFYFTTDQQAYWFFGAIPAANISAVYNRLHTMMAALGASAC